MGRQAFTGSSCLCSRPHHEVDGAEEERGHWLAMLVERRLKIRPSHQELAYELIECLARVGALNEAGCRLSIWSDDQAEVHYALRAFIERAGRIVRGLDPCAGTA